MFHNIEFQQLVNLYGFNSYLAILIKFLLSKLVNFYDKKSKVF
jgi:hypothetical protein